MKATLLTALLTTAVMATTTLAATPVKPRPNAAGRGEAAAQRQAAVTAQKQAQQQAAQQREQQAAALRQQQQQLQAQRTELQTQQQAIREKVTSGALTKQQGQAELQGLQQRQAALKQDAGATREQAAQKKEQAAANRGNVVDKRQANQEHRINQGIKKDQLTDDEVVKLKSLEGNIQTLEDQFKTDGKVTKDEGQQLRKLLNEASLQIWSERHDTEGAQKPAMRLGKDVFAKDELTAKIESGDMTKEQARAFLKDFHTLANLRRRLATETLTAEERAKLQGRYDELLTKYFIVK